MNQAAVESASPAILPKASKLRKRDRSLGTWVIYKFLQVLMTSYFSLRYGFRATGREPLPSEGGMLLVSNHLSHLDVIILGATTPRPLNFVARSSLFFFPLKPIIIALGALPIRRDGMGAEGLKETLRRLRAGGIVTLFPEGSRSQNGELGVLKSGIGLLASRAKVPIVPVAIAGAFEAWPRSSKLPRPHPLRVHYGAPITPTELVGMNADAVAELLRDRLLVCQRTARGGLVGDLGEANLASREIEVGQFGPLD